MIRGMLVSMGAMAALVVPASASAATITLPAPALGDMSAAATTVSASRAPTLRVTRAGAADLVVAAVARRGGRYTVVVAAFNRPPSGSSSRSTVVRVSAPGARLRDTVVGGSLFSGRSPTCTEAEDTRYAVTYRGRFSALRGRIPALPSGIRPALLAKFGAYELCGASYEQHSWLTRFAWDVAPTAHLPVAAGVTQSWAPGATSGRICVHLSTNPPQPGAAVRAAVAPTRGRSYSGTGTLGADGSTTVVMQVGSPGDYDLQVALNGTPVAAGFLLTLPGPQYGRTATTCP